MRLEQRLRGMVDTRFDAIRGLRNFTIACSCVHLCTR